MNMVEEVSNTWIWCSRIVSRSIEHKQITKSDIPQYDMLEGRSATSLSKDTFGGHSGHQMWSHPRSGPKEGAKNG